MKRTLLALGLAAGLSIAFSGGRAAFADDFNSGFRANHRSGTAHISVTNKSYSHGPVVTVGYRHRESCDYRGDYDRHARRSYRKHLRHDCWCGHDHSHRHYAERYRHRHAHRDSECGSYSFYFRW